MNDESSITDYKYMYVHLWCVFLSVCFAWFSVCLFCMLLRLKANTGYNSVVCPDYPLFTHTHTHPTYTTISHFLLSLFL